MENRVDLESLKELLKGHSLNDYGFMALTHSNLKGSQDFWTLAPQIIQELSQLRVEVEAGRTIRGHLGSILESWAKDLCELYDFKSKI